MEHLYKGFLNIFKKEDTNRKGDKVVREVMSRSSDKNSDDSVAGIVYDNDKDIYYFVNQLRAGCKEEDKFLTEVVAGTLENGEDPKICFKRECKEEIGVNIEEIYMLPNPLYTSPGGTTERIFLFLSSGTKLWEGGGLESEQEDIEIIEVKSKDLKNFSKNIKDLKTSYLINEILNS